MVKNIRRLQRIQTPWHFFFLLPLSTSYVWQSFCFPQVLHYNKIQYHKTAGGQPWMWCCWLFLVLFLFVVDISYFEDSLKKKKKKIWLQSSFGPEGGGWRKWSLASLCEKYILGGVREGGRWRSGGEKEKGGTGVVRNAEGKRRRGSETKIIIIK